ncbi:MAG: hypothetical protein AAFW84_36220 [Cyanobacteria bacterium J06635_15]
MGVSKGRVNNPQALSVPITTAIANTIPNQRTAFFIDVALTCHPCPL